MDKRMKVAIVIAAAGLLIAGEMFYVQTDRGSTQSGKNLQYGSTWDGSGNAGDFAGYDGRGFSCH